jgi:hypothetical protein
MVNRPDPQPFNEAAREVARALMQKSTETSPFIECLRQGGAKGFVEFGLSALSDLECTPRAHTPPGATFGRVEVGVGVGGTPLTASSSAATSRERSSTAAPSSTASPTLFLPTTSQPDAATLQRAYTPTHWVSKLEEQGARGYAPLQCRECVESVYRLCKSV